VFPAQITAIAPLATTTQGVVNYQVTVKLTSLVPLSSSMSGAASMPTGTMVLPEGFTPPAGFTPGSGTGRSTNLPSGAARPSGIPTALPTDSPRFSGTDRSAAGGFITTSAAAVSLKQGLTVSVTITIQEKNNVLVVPNRAISKAAGESVVQLVNGTSVTAQTVKTGLSDSSNTEITEGLKAGDIVQVRTTTSSTNTNMFGAGSGSGQRIQIR
ncbi:MAG TPA: hypothetical protein VLH15_08840, partial [Dehalococcoidales bacterium]|nr:hypothetical protein [Dehalococcoidales bacterium]